MAIQVIVGSTGSGKTLFATAFSKILKDLKYDYIAANYRMDHNDKLIKSLSDFDSIPKQQSILIIMDEAYEDIDSRRSFDDRVNRFTRNLMQLRKRGGRGYDTDCWIVAQDFFMIDYRIRQNATIIIHPNIVSWTQDGKPSFMIVDLQKYHPIHGLGRKQSFSLYVLPFLESYDSDKQVSETKFEDITLKKIVEKYQNDVRSRHITKTDLGNLIYYESQINPDLSITKSNSKMVAGLIKTYYLHEELQKKKLI